MHLLNHVQLFHIYTLYMLTWKMEIYQEVGGRLQSSYRTGINFVFYDLNISLFQLSNIVPLPQVHAHVGTIFHLSTMLQKATRHWLVTIIDMHVTKDLGVLFVDAVHVVRVFCLLYNDLICFHVLSPIVRSQVRFLLFICQYDSLQHFIMMMMH